MVFLKYVITVMKKRNFFKYCNFFRFFLGIFFLFFILNFTLFYINEFLKWYSLEITINMIFLSTVKHIKIEFCVAKKCKMSRKIRFI